MQYEIETDAGVFAYTLRRTARVRRLSIVVRAGGEIVVTAPAQISENAIEVFFKKSARRIARAVSYFSQVSKPVPLPAATEPERRALEEKIRPALARAAELLRIPTPLFKVRTMRSRFGSCSARGALAFSDTLRALPNELFEYIVVHEAAHCVEHNHSPAFWALVEQIIPDWRARRAALKKYNFVIHRL
ncbi:MAG: DUF45 domain-containing protein [bacterium]|nr:DUF45 domain-containing protein [bacterium]